MKVSLNLAQEYSNVDLKSIPRDELLRRIGAQLGAVEEVIDWAPKFEGAVIVKVVSCDPHPNADKLHVCMVDDGSGQNTQVVCGAPNVHAGMYAVWLKPGTVVPSTRDTDPFALEAREIRGVVSNGMMASAKELGISDNHDGILEITEADILSPQSSVPSPQLRPGMALTELFGLDDFVIDCENKMFTHRPDCFGNLGVARELAGISGLKFESPIWYKEMEFLQPGSKLGFKTQNDIKELVPRFCAQVVEGVTVKPSPVWMQATLARVGIKSINNIVDLTNYYMHLTAQPTHAFDYDKLKALSSGDEPMLFPRMAQDGEELTLLGGKTIKLSSDDIVIATDQKAVALAGIMGGAETEVDSNTKNILVEAATFDMYAIRRSSMRHGLFTDASTRFNKGQSPMQNAKVLFKLCSDICKQTGAVIGMNNDIQTMRGMAPPVTVSAEFINQRLGSALSAADMKQLLENVEFEVELREDTLEIIQPFWRMDIEIPEDIVEEIGRLYGYDKLPVQLPGRAAKPTARNKLATYKSELREVLKQRGANEVLTYSFVHGDLLRKTGTNPEERAFHLRNALSPDLQYYRTSIMPSLLAKVHANIKAQAGNDDNTFALFEIGKAHNKSAIDADGLPVQFELLGLVLAADDKTAKVKTQGAAFYQVKKYLDILTNGQAALEPLAGDEDLEVAAYEPGRSALIYVGESPVGVIGEFKAGVRKSLKLPDYCAGLELDITALQAAVKPRQYQPLPAYPASQQDLTLEVNQDISYGQVADTLSIALSTAQQEHGYKGVIEPLDIFQPEGADAKRLTFRLQVHHPERTLTTTEVSALIDGLADVAAASCNAARV